MPRPVHVSVLVTPILALAIAGCDGGGSVMWLVRPGEEPTAAEPPFELSSGGFLVAGYSYRSPTAGDDYPILEPLSEDAEVLTTKTPPLTEMRIDPAPDGHFAFAGKATDPDRTSLIGLMDERGKVVSSSIFDGAGFAHADAGGGFYLLGAVTGASPEDAFVTKVDGDGDPVWAYHRNQLHYNRMFDAVFRKDGGVIAAGLTADSFPPEDSFLARIDPNGAEVWSLLFENTGLLDIEEDPDTGTIYATGWRNNDVLVGAVDADGQQVFWKTFDGNSPEHQIVLESGWTVSVRPAAGGSTAEILVGGSFSDAIDFGLDEPLRGRDDAFLLAMSPSGEPIWQMSGSSEGSDIFQARYASDGNILASLYFSTGGYRLAHREVHVGGRTFELRGVIDSAVMKIER